MDPVVQARDGAGNPNVSGCRTAKMNRDGGEQRAESAERCESIVWIPRSLFRSPRFYRCFSRKRMLPTQSLTLFHPPRARCQRGSVGLGVGQGANHVGRGVLKGDDFAFAIGHLWPDDHNDFRSRAATSDLIQQGPLGWTESSGAGHALPMGHGRGRRGQSVGGWRCLG